MTCDMALLMSFLSIERLKLCTPKVLFQCVNQMGEIPGKGAEKLTRALVSLCIWRTEIDHERTFSIGSPAAQYL